jgi:hypothetical protein
VKRPGVTWAIGVVLIASATGSADPVEPEPIRLVYSAPAGCPDADAFFAGVAARAAASRVAAGDAREFRVTLAETEAGATGTLVVTSEDGETVREVSGKTCEETVQALALVAALAIEQRAAEIHVAPPVPPPRPPPGTEQRPWHVAVGTGVEVETGVAPGAVAAVPVFVTTTRGDTGLELRLGATRTEQDDVTMTAGTTAFRWTVGWVDACPFAIAAWRMVGRACAGAEAGVLEGRGETVGSPADNERPWVAPRGTLSLVLGLGRVKLAVAARGGVPLVRDRFYIAPAATVHETPWITGGFGVTASVDLR